ADVAPVPGLDFFADEETRLIALLAIGAAIALCLGTMLFLIFRLFRKRPSHAPDLQDELKIDVAALPASPPPRDGPQLEFYGTPVRLAVMVLAPVGRAGEIPAPADLTVTLENLLPGLQEIVSRHHPQVVLWPNQLSSQGFLQAFFNLAALPGDHGKGTPWCSVAGKFEGGGQQYLAGLICCSTGPNSLGEMTVDKPGQWLSVLRVRASS
ncbi:MAG: hypothetical protein IAF94_18535, partial [Pirellulaceae bacterium]|nr:hypothetical protein [Pirellulaceae bacterium]